VNTDPQLHSPMGCVFAPLVEQLANRIGVDAGLALKFQPRRR